MNRNLYLIRGLPGSGKSTFAARLAECLGAVHCEADHYFLDEHGNYNWDGNFVYEAHLWCRALARESMEDGKPVVISNTSTTVKEIKPYLALALEHGYDVTSLITENRHGNSSIHNVPQETMDKMRNRFSIQL